MRLRDMAAAMAVAVVLAGGVAVAEPAAPDRVTLEEAPEQRAAPMSMMAAREATGGQEPAATQSAAAAVGSGGSVFTSTAPVRVVDTRNGTGVPAGAVPGGGVVTLDLSARVPESATAVVLNLTGVTPTLATVVTVWPAGVDRPTTSNINLRAGEIRANAVTVALGAGRKLSFYNNSGSTHLVADLAGYYAPATGSRFTAQAPVRLLDTRESGGALGPGGTRTINLSGRVPATATAVTFNLTGVGASLATFVTAWPAGSPRPTASTLNLAPGEITPNLVTVALGTDRNVTLYNNSGSTHLVADLAGYYATDRGNPFYQLTPRRVLDTRPGDGLSGGEIGTMPLATDLPASASAVVLNLTGTNASTATFLTAYPSGAARPTASNLNLVGGQTAANLVTVALGAGTKLDVFNQTGYVDFLLDLAGYFAPPPAACGAECVHSWGDNRRGQLGVGTTGGSSTAPGRVDGLADVRAVTAGELNGYALKGDGSVWAWGADDFAGLGVNRGVGASTVPVKVNQLANVTQIAAGAYTAYAVDSSKRVWAWGYNGDGSAGDGSVVTKTQPVPINLPSDALQIAAGHTTGYALRANGTVWAWGANGGALGNGAYGTGCETLPVGPGCRAVTPMEVPGLTGVKSIAATSNAAFAVKSDGTVWAWGFNAHGELGLGTAGGPACYDAPTGPNCTALSPVQIPGLTGVAKVTTGGTSTTYAIKTDGTVLSWGWNGDGQLGNGTTGVNCTDPAAPNCARPTPGVVPGLTNVTSIVAGNAYAMALTSRGGVWSWGNNRFGQLGGDPAPANQPRQVPGLTGVTAIGAGGYTSLAVT